MNGKQPHQVLKEFYKEHSVAEDNLAEKRRLMKGFVFVPGYPIGEEPLFMLEKQFLKEKGYNV